MNSNFLSSIGLGNIDIGYIFLGLVIANVLLLILIIIAFVQVGKFKKKYKNRVNMKIDLVDSKGDKVNISTKADLYSNEYLVEKTVYELNWFNEENPDNIVMEPLKFDGYCMRSIDEDAKYEELEKSNTKGKKPAAKKK